MLLVLLTKGGPIVWIIVGLSVVSTAIILECVFVLRALRRLLLAKGGGEGPGWQTLARVADCLFKGKQRQRRAQEWQKTAWRLARQSPEQAGLFLASSLSRRLRVIGIIGHLLPLLGLLGTITGMIRVFMQLELIAAPHVSHLAGGLWEALLTTAVGLAAAIPTLAFYHYLEGRVDELSLYVADAIESASGEQ